jgi:hypothetical protein
VATVETEPRTYDGHAVTDAVVVVSGRFPVAPDDPLLDALLLGRQVSATVTLEGGSVAHTIRWGDENAIVTQTRCARVLSVELLD